MALAAPSARRDDPAALEDQVAETTSTTSPNMAHCTRLDSGLRMATHDTVNRTKVNSALGSKARLPMRICTPALPSFSKASSHSRTGQ